MKEGMQGLPPRVPYENQRFTESGVGFLRGEVKEYKLALILGRGGPTMEENSLCPDTPYVIKKFQDRGIPFVYVDLEKQKQKDKIYEELGFINRTKDIAPIVVLGNNYVIWHTGDALNMALDVYKGQLPS